MLPFEFTVEGPPVSHQAKDKKRLMEWRERVRAAARGAWPPGEEPTANQVELVITYYHEGSIIRSDTDNIAKPIQDALAGIVYIDDNQVTDTKVRKTSIDGSFRARRMSPVVAAAFVRGEQFLHVRVAARPDHSEFLA